MKILSESKTQPNSMGGAPGAALVLLIVTVCCRACVAIDTPAGACIHSSSGECQSGSITTPPGERTRVQSPVSYSTADGWQDLAGEGAVRPKAPVAFYVNGEEQEALRAAGGFVEGRDYSLHALGGRHGGSIVNRQMYHVWPQLAAGYPLWERSFDAGPINTWMEDNGWIPLTACAFYMAAIVAGKMLMANRPAFELRRPLAAWNLLLAAFSTMGMLRAVPHALTQLKLEGFHHLVCFDPVQKGGLSGAGGFWTLAFVLSKLPELVDTAWIVARKRPLIFLHWYHHVTVLLFCWHCYVVRSSLGLPFMAMNFSVHAVMYGYYWAAAMRIWPKRISPAFITVMQLAQMAGGVWCCAASAYYKHQAAAAPEQAPCYVADETLVWGGLMYGSYFALFAQFLVRRFVFPPSKLSKSKPRRIDTAPEMCVGAVPSLDDAVIKPPISPVPTAVPTASSPSPFSPPAFFGVARLRRGT